MSIGGGPRTLALVLLALLLWIAAGAAGVRSDDDFAVTSLACVGTDGLTRYFSFPGVMASVCSASGGSKGLAVDGQCLLASIQNTTAMPDVVGMAKNRYSCSVVGYAPFRWNVSLGYSASRSLSRNVAANDLSAGAGLMPAVVTARNFSSQYEHYNDASYMLNTAPGYTSVCCQGLCPGVCRMDDRKSDCSYFLGINYKAIPCGSSYADSWCQVVGSNEVKILQVVYSGHGLTLDVTGAASMLVSGQSYGSAVVQETNSTSLNVSLPGASVQSMCIAKNSSGSLYSVACSDVRECDPTAPLFMLKAGCSGTTSVAETMCSPIVYTDGNWDCRCGSTSSSILSTLSPASETSSSIFSVPELQAEVQVSLKSVGEQVVLNRTALTTSIYGYWVAPAAILSGRAELYTYVAPTTGWGGCTAVALDNNGTIAANMFAYAYPKAGNVHVVAALNCGWSLMLCNDCMSGSGGVCSGPVWSSNSSVCLDKSNSSESVGQNSTATNTTLPAPVCANTSDCGIIPGNVTPEGTSLTAGPGAAVIVGSSLGSAGLLGVFVLAATCALCCCITLCVLLVMCLIVAVLATATVAVVLFMVAGAVVLVGRSRGPRSAPKGKEVHAYEYESSDFETMEI